jgi:hypothetical protein
MEETLRKSFTLVLTAVGVSASYAQGITSVGRDPVVSDPSTWRWQVSSILGNQQRPPSESALIEASRTDAFDQRYQRYSVTGLPEGRSR